MKKITLLAILIASLMTANSQLSFSVPVGVSTNKVPVIGTNFQLAIGGFIVATGFDAQMSRKVKDGDLFYARAGAAFNLSEQNKVELTAGAGQYRRSTDIKSLNVGVLLANIQYVHALDSKHDGSLFAGITVTNKLSILSGGLRFTFRKNERDGCPSSWIR